MPTGKPLRLRYLSSHLCTSAPDLLKYLVLVYKGFTHYCTLRHLVMYTNGNGKSLLTYRFANC